MRGRAPNRRLAECQPEPREGSASVAASCPASALPAPRGRRRRSLDDAPHEPERGAPRDARRDASRDARWGGACDGDEDTRRRRQGVPVDCCSGNRRERDEASIGTPEVRHGEQIDAIGGEHTRLVISERPLQLLLARWQERERVLTDALPGCVYVAQLRRLCDEFAGALDEAARSPGWLSTADAGALLGVTSAAVVAQIRRGAWRSARKIGARWLLERQEVAWRLHAGR